jgi:diguanylate cyclase (GGDEF)-like protein
MTTAHDARRPYCETCRKPLVDGLTGVLDRREWDRRAAEAVAAAGERGRPVALILADLDSFKDVNDTYGHLAGDAVLRAVAGVLGDVSRGIVGRYGGHAGDEFLVLLPDATATEATAVARRTQARVRGLSVTARASRSTTVTLGGQTVSMGVAAEETDAARPDVLGNLLLDADVGLRAAKSEGGDLVCEPGPDVSAGEAAAEGGAALLRPRVPRARRAGARAQRHGRSRGNRGDGGTGGGTGGEVRIPLASFGQEPGGGPDELVLSSAAAEHLHELLTEVLGRRPWTPVSTP